MDFAQHLKNASWSKNTPASLPSWMQASGSMTAAMQAKGGQITVQVAYQGWQTDHQWCRQVLMYSDDQPWLWAQADMPKTTCDAFPELLTLDNQPLGHFLFQQHHAKRSSFDFCFFAQENLWGRRSEFSIEGHALLLTEIFLPQMCEAFAND